MKACVYCANGCGGCWIGIDFGRGGDIKETQDIRRVFEGDLRKGLPEYCMPEHAVGADQTEPRGISVTTEKPPKPGAADVPPADSWLSEDQLDLMENARTGAGQRLRTDLILLSVYVAASLILILAIALIWRHHFHR